MPEDVSDPLALARKHLQLENPSAALEAINELLEKNQHDITAHQLRIEALIHKFDEPEKLLDSLTFLRDSAPTIYDDLVDKTGDAIQEHLTELYDDTLGSFNRRPLNRYTERIDTLAILAEFFPVVYFARGLIYKLAVKQDKSRSENRDRDDNDRGLLSSLSRFNRSDSPPRARNPLSKVTHESGTDNSQWENTALESFKSAIKYITDDAPLQAEIYKELAHFYAENDQPLHALLTCDEAEAKGLDIAEVKETLTEHIQKDATERILQHLDTALAQGRLGRASDIITRYMPEPPTEAWLIREAELAMLCGNLQRSAEIYDQLISTKPEADKED